jgi:SAM-dependent methyltransferase
MTNQELQEKVNALKWYHPIHVKVGIDTVPECVFTEVWELIGDGMKTIDFHDKSVLDIGTRDGKYAFQAEENGASSVLAIDNDQSPGALLLKEVWESNVDFKEMNLYQIPAMLRFDIILFFGVLYHLRYPMEALRKITQALNLGGKLYIESGMMDRYNEPMVYCPVRTSPYEVTSCTFFNVNGLTETLWSFGCTVNSVKAHPTQDDDIVRRMWIEVTKTHEPDAALMNYWEGTHHSHN